MKRSKDIFQISSIVSFKRKQLLHGRELINCIFWVNYHFNTQFSDTTESYASSIESNIGLNIANNYNNYLLDKANILTSF